MLRRAQWVAAGSTSAACKRFDRAEGLGEGRADRAGAAAQVHDDGRVRGLREGLLDEVLGAAAGDEHAGFHMDAQAGELGPADDVFEGQAGDAPLDHRGEFVMSAGGGEDQSRLVLGEDTARGTERGDDGGGGKRGHESREPFGR